MTNVPYEVALLEPRLLPEAGPLAMTHYVVVTPYVPITRSDDGNQKIFVNQALRIGRIDTKRFRVTLSSLPNTDAPIICDDAISVNGHIYGGFSGVTVDPLSLLGQNPEVCYKPVPAIDISNDLRCDGMLFIQLLDLGGAAFGASGLYVRIASLV